MKTQETKHTPGPWRVIAPKTWNSGWPLIESANGLLVAKTDCSLNSDALPTETERIANARLIAAAPELLEACRQALWTLGECSVGREKLSDLFPVKVKQLQAAILKATGGNQP